MNIKVSYALLAKDFRTQEQKNRRTQSTFKSLSRRRVSNFEFGSFPYSKNNRKFFFTFTY